MTIEKTIQYHSDDVYQEIAEHQSEPTGAIHTLGCCDEFTNKLIRKLSKEEDLGGISERKVMWLRDQRIHGIIRPVHYIHKYVSLVPAGSDELFVDGTWQQFLNKDLFSESLPRVAIGSRSDIFELAVAAGVPVNVAETIWQPIPRISIKS